MTDEIKAVEFVAEVRQVKTMADHTVNVTLNLPEYCGDQSAWFLKYHGSQVRCIVVLAIEEHHGTPQNVTQTESDREPNY